MSRSTNAGAFLWIGSFVSAGHGPSSSTGSPSTLKIRPRIVLPTGTESAAPVSTTVIPRCKPSVALIDTARTRLSPRSCCTSATIFTSFPDSSLAVISSEL